MNGNRLETTAFVPSFENGEEVLAFHRGKWRHVIWSQDMGKWHLGNGQPFILHTADRAYAPLPPKPKDGSSFYDFVE